MQDISQFTVADQARMILGAGDGYIELRGRRPQERTVSKRGWYSRDQLADLERRIAGLPRHNVWIGAAPRRERNRGTAADILPAWALWQDCDTPQAVERLRAFHPVPTLVVQSSSERRQAWWRLAEPLEPDAIVPALARIRAALDADKNCVDRARVMRPVGGVNHGHGAPQPVVCRLFTGEVHDIGTVLAACPLVLEPAESGAGRGEHKAVERVPAGERHLYLKDFAVRLLRGGITDRDTLEALLRCQYDRVCEPGDAASIPGIAKWAAEKSRIAERERAMRGGESAFLRAFRGDAA